MTFSKEVCHYERRFEEDYDMPDEKYEQCLKLYHTQPQESTPANDYQDLYSTLHLSYILLSLFVIENTSGQVLTIVQNLKKMEEKKKKKSYLKSKADWKSNRKSEKRLLVH